MATSWDIKLAMQEVLAKTDQQIDEETAYKWASRVIACYRMALMSAFEREMEEEFSSVMK
jgi:hypothetical protein